MTELLEKSKVVQVTFLLALPISATREQIAEWVGLHLACSDMAGDNPLGEYGVDALGEPVLHDTGLYLHRHITRERDGRWTMRFSTEHHPYWGPTATDLMVAEYHAARDGAAPRHEGETR